ncbi:hypothetical protein AAZX31_19G056900 [Glycine max]
MNTSAHAKEQDDNKPLWNYVTILRVLGSGNFEIKDNMCEVNFNGSYTLDTYSFIHFIKRNKMTPHRAEDLVFVHSSLHLLSRIANLSLDEPELEVVFFNEDDQEGSGRT